MVVFGQKRFDSGNVVVFVQSDNIREKWVVIGQKWFYSGKVLVFGKMVVSNKSCCIGAKLVVIGQGLVFAQELLY